MEFTEQPMRPPQEARSFLPRATQGRTYNEYRFCYVSRGYPFMAVTPDQLKREILVHKPFFPDNATIYMTGSNPFALPAGKLKTHIAVLRKHFPHLTRVRMQNHDGIHSLNPRNSRFPNKDAEAKRRVLENIDDVLRSCTDNELKMTVSRHLK